VIDLGKKLLHWLYLELVGWAHLLQGSVRSFSSYNLSGFIYLLWLAENTKMECETHCAPQPSFQIKNAWSITFASTMHLHSTVLKYENNFTFEIIVMIVFTECFLSSDDRISLWLLLWSCIPYFKAWRPELALGPVMWPSGIA
jgi:hypothetical protein